MVDSKGNRWDTLMRFDKDMLPTAAHQRTSLWEVRILEETYLHVDCWILRIEKLMFLILIGVEMSHDQAKLVENQNLKMQDGKERDS
jgi:hypothetical protein